MQKRQKLKKVGVVYNFLGVAFFARRQKYDQEVMVDFLHNFKDLVSLVEENTKMEMAKWDSGDDWGKTWVYRTLMRVVTAVYQAIGFARLYSVTILYF